MSKVNILLSTGQNIEGEQATPGGVIIPTTALRALAADGLPYDVKTSAAGALWAAPPDIQTVTKNLTSATASGNVAAQQSGEHILLVPNGHNTVDYIVSGTWAGVWTAEKSLDGGANWFSFLGNRQDVVGTGPVSSSTGNASVRASVQAGTLIRVRFSTFTSGTMTVRMATSFGAGEPVVTVGGGAITLNSGTGVVGAVRLGAIQRLDYNAALAASATYTGTSRDLATQAPDNLIAAGYMGEFRGQTKSDVAHTLYLEISNDNFTTVDRIRAVAAANTDTGGAYCAAISHSPCDRYARFVVVNGAGASARTKLVSTQRA